MMIKNGNKNNNELMQNNTSLLFTFIFECVYRMNLVARTGYEQDNNRVACKPVIFDNVAMLWARNVEN